MDETKYQVMWGLVDHYKIEFDLGAHRDLTCTLCHNIARNPLQSMCGCRFCHHCLQIYVESDGKRCPGLTEDCETELVHINDQVNPDYAAKRDIGDILVKCPLEPCEAISKLIDLDDHIKLHEKCPFYWIGCQTFSLDAFDRHHVDHHHSHMELLVNSIVNMERQANQTNSVVENQISQVRSTVTEEVNRLHTTVEDLSKSKSNEEILTLVHGMIESLEEQHRADRAKVSTDLTQLSVKQDLLDTQINRLNVGLESVETQQELTETQQMALVTRLDQTDLETKLGALEATLLAMQDNQTQMQTDLSACLKMSEKQLFDFAVTNSSMMSNVSENLSGHVRNIIDLEIKKAMNSPAQHYWPPQPQYAAGLCPVVLPPSPLEVADHGPKKKRLKREMTPVTPVKGSDSGLIVTHPSPAQPNLRPLKSDSNWLQYVVDKFSLFQPMGKEMSVIYSEPFSSPVGHQFRLAVYPNGVDEGAGTHLSVRLLSVPSDRDHVLHWPHQHTFIVSLLNQKTEQPMFSKPCLEIPWLVSRPTVGSVSRHKGESRFYKLKQLINNDALYRNDSIIIIVSISI